MLLRLRPHNAFLRGPVFKVIRLRDSVRTSSSIQLTTMYKYINGDNIYIYLSKGDSLVAKLIKREPPPHLELNGRKININLYITRTKRYKGNIVVLIKRKKDKKTRKETREFLKSK